MAESCPFHTRKKQLLLHDITFELEIIEKVDAVISVCDSINYLIPDEDMEELLALENYIPADKLGEQKKLLQGGDDSE